MNTGEKVSIRVNGDERVIHGDTSVLSLLREIGAQPERVAVMVNESVIRRGELDTIRLRDGDCVEIVTFAGGGGARYGRNEP
jgi:thiamine biosynthesis protein ThiS